MSGRSDRPVDKYGFPVPATFDDVPLGPSSTRGGLLDTPRRVEVPTDAGRRSLADLLAPRPDGLGADRPQRHHSRMLWRGLLVVAGFALVTGTLGKTFWEAKGPATIARWYLEMAEERELDGDTDAALAHLDQALAWAPEDVDAIKLRADLRLRQGDLAGSLDDYTQLAERMPRYAPVYWWRSLVLQRLERHGEAIDDLTRALECGTAEQYVNTLNSRAYARAIAGVDLEAALADIEESIRLSGQAPAAFLDTRGYIQHLLGNDDAALDDLSAALALAEDEKRAVLRNARLARADRRLVARWSQQYDETLGVILHHRGLVHERLGNVQLAADDLRRGDELGYNPAAGVF